MKFFKIKKNPTLNNFVLSNKKAFPIRFFYNECISSVKHESIKKINLLWSNVGRKNNGQFLLPGKYLKMAAGYNCEELFVLHSSYDKYQKQLSEINLNVPIKSVSSGVMQKICNNKKELDAVLIVKTPRGSIEEIQKAESVLVLDKIQNEHNIGAIMRVALGSNIKNLIFLDKNPEDYFTSTIIQASVGCIMKLNIVTMSHEFFLQFIQKSGHHVLITSPHAAKECHEVDFSRKNMIVIGNETLGVDTKLMTSFKEHIKIPLNTEIESFNLVVAAGIILYEQNRQKRFPEKQSSNEPYCSPNIGR